MSLDNYEVENNLFAFDDEDVLNVVKNIDNIHSLNNSVLSINHYNYDVDKDYLSRNSDFFNNYYELAVNDENIDIDAKYSVDVIRNTLDIIMLNKVHNVVDIVLSKELLYYFCVKSACLDVLDAYVLDNLQRFRKFNNIVLFYYEPKYVNEMSVSDCLIILEKGFNSMNENEFMYLLSVTIGVVDVDDFLPYLKYFDYNKGECFYKHTKYQKYESVIDETWKERLATISNGLIIPEGVAVLGGSVGYVLNKHLNIDDYQGDIDLYIIGGSKQERVDKLKSCISLITEQFENVGMYVTLKHYLNVYSLECEGMPTIQVINSRENCIEDIFNMYDLSASRIGIIDGRLISDMSGIMTLITQTITINENANTKMCRLLKYVDRGFSIQFDRLYYVDGKYMDGNAIKIAMKQGNKNKYNVQYTDVQFDDIKEYNVCWVRCYNNEAYAEDDNKINNKKLTYCIKNTVVHDDTLILDDMVVNYLNKKIKKQKVIEYNNRLILMGNINKNLTKIPITGKFITQYKENIIQYIPNHSLCNVTVQAKLNTHDFRMVLQIIHVQVKRINYN